MAYQPKGKRFEEFEVGDEFVTAARTITEGDVSLFAGLSGDFNPLHMNEEHAKKTPFGGRIAHGLLGVAVATGLANQLGIFEGTTHALLSMNVRYTGAVRFGDTLRVKLSVREKKETSKEDRGIVVFDAAVLNQKDEVVVESEWTLLMARGD
jgi:acyl dehydratase